MLTEYSIDHKIYIDVKEVRANCKQFCKGTRSISQLIETKGFQDVIFGRILDGTIEITASMSRRVGTAFVNKEELSELFVEDANTPKLPPAPPVIADKDLVFFKDDQGSEYDVLMRGERTRKGIYFKVKDVERVFQMDRLDKTIQKEHTAYHAGSDYQWFIVSAGDNVPNSHNERRELYLTYNGLMRVIYRSNSGVATQFRNWIDDCVFAMSWGTKDQKSKVVARSLNVDADHLRAIMKKHPNTITCLYLIDVIINDSGKRVFKYGFTNNLQRRFGEHMTTYGKDIKLDTFIFIPELDLSKAEATFRKSISVFQYTAIEGRDELISLCEDSYVMVQTIFSTIASKYCGNFREQIAYHQSRIKDMETQIVINKYECSSAIANNNAELIAAKKDVEIYQLKIQLLEMKIQALSS